MLHTEKWRLSAKIYELAPLYGLMSYYVYLKRSFRQHRFFNAVFTAFQAHHTRSGRVLRLHVCLIDKYRLFSFYYKNMSLVADLLSIVFNK